MNKNISILIFAIISSVIFSTLLFCSKVSRLILQPESNKLINSKIAFMSFRHGNFEIYVMNVDGSTQTRLTKNSYNDYFPSWSPEGSKIVFHSRRDGNFEIYVMNADGSTQTRLTNNAAIDMRPSWSPDGSKIVFNSNRDGNLEIYAMNEGGSKKTRLTNNPAFDGDPSWSPGGSEIAFYSNRDGNFEVYVMNADGSKKTRLTKNSYNDYFPSWSPGGSKIAFESNRDGNFEIYVMNADGSKVTRLTSNPAEDRLPSWSPEGSKIAFYSNRDGNSEIYVMNADGSNQTRLTNNPAEDRLPSWSPFIKPTARPTQAQDKMLTLVEVERGRVAYGLDGLNYPINVTITPDGTHVYVAGLTDNAIAVFNRNSSTGTLTFVGAHFNGEDGIEGLNKPADIAISPDGEFLYVAVQYDDGITVFNRNSTTGALTFVEFITNGKKGVNGLDDPLGITVSPDGKHLYLANRDSSALAVFKRDMSTGVLTFVELLQDNIGGIDGLKAAREVIVSQDGKNVYVASGVDAVAAFSRNENTGQLTFMEVHKNGVYGVDGLSGNFDIIESPDGAHIYVASASDDAVAVFSRNSSTGGLMFVEMQKNGVYGVNGIDRPFGIDFSPDGNYIYVTGSNSNAVAVFSRDSDTGTLTFVEVQKNNVGNVQGLEGPWGVAVSPDGTHVYVTGWIDDALLVFERNGSTGTLAFLEVHRDTGGLEYPRTVTVSPDEKFVYVTSQKDDAVSVFQRDPDNGELALVETYRNGLNGVDGIDGAYDVTISPDGAHLYVTANDNDAVAVFSRNIKTGKLAFVEAQINGVNGVEGLDGAMFAETSPDGKHVYVTGFKEHALVVFSRDIITGELTFVENHVNGVNGAKGLAQASGLIVSPDGKNVYVDGQEEDAVAVFSRNENTGQLTFMEIHKNGVNGVDGLDGGSGDIAINSDGKYLYVAGYSDDAIVVFSRNTETGELTFVEVHKNGADGVKGLDGAWRLALSPDGSILYVTGRIDNALALFERNISTGKLTFLDAYKDGVDGIDGLKTADGISISPNGLNIYITSRIDNAIAVLKLLK